MDKRAKRTFLRPTKLAPRSRADRTRIIGIIFASIIVCALVAGGVLPVIIDRMNQSPGVAAPPSAVADEPGEYEQQLRAEIERQPENPQLMVSLANLLVAQGASDEAISWYERAVELDPDRIETRLDFGAALARRGSLSDAEVQFQRAIDIDAGNADAHYLLGDLYVSWQPSRTDEAIAEFERSIAAQPGSVAASRAGEALAGLNRGNGTPVATPAGDGGSPTMEDKP